MNKSELINGMIVEFQDGARRLFWNNRLIDEQGYIPMEIICDDLTYINNEVDMHIVKVYETFDIYSINDFFLDRNLRLIWQRPIEIEDNTNWDEVFIGTRVLISNDKEEWNEHYFIKYFNPGENQDTVFITLDPTTKEILTWKYCRLKED